MIECALNSHAIDWIILDLLKSLAINEMVKHISAYNFVHLFYLFENINVLINPKKTGKYIPIIWLYIKRYYECCMLRLIEWEHHQQT